MGTRHLRYSTCIMVPRPGGGEPHRSVPSGVQRTDNNHARRRGGHLRRRTDSNCRIKVLQTSPLPLGYGAGTTKNEEGKRKKWSGRSGDRRTQTTHFFVLPSHIFLLKSGPSRHTWRDRRAALNAPCALSGKRDSNPRHQPWQGCALPTELFPQNCRSCNIAIHP